MQYGVRVSCVPFDPQQRLECCASCRGYCHFSHDIKALVGCRLVIQSALKQPIELPFIFDAGRYLLD